jgi:PhnB protein
MSSTNVKPIPEGMHTVTPHLVCARAAEAIEFYKRAFAAHELSRLAGDDGQIMHAALRIGGSVIMLTEEYPEWNSLGPLALKGSPVTLHLYVEDADRLFEQAVAAGASTRMPVAEMFWGDRYGVLEDPFGHRWSVATHVRDLTPEEIQEGMRRMSRPEAEVGTLS